MTVRELDERMTLTEFFAWQQYDEWRAADSERRQNEQAEEQERMERLQERVAEHRAGS